MLIPSLTVRRISSREWARGPASTRSQHRSRGRPQITPRHLTFQVLSVRWMVLSQPCSTRTGLQVDVPRRNGRGRRNPCGTGRGLGFGRQAPHQAPARSRPARSRCRRHGDRGASSGPSGRATTIRVRCQRAKAPSFARVSLRMRGSAGSGWSPYGAVWCWPRSENEQRDEIGGDTDPCGGA